MSPTILMGRATLLVGGWLLGALSLANALDLPDLIAHAKPSVVGVGTFEPLRAPQHLLGGTGFVVGDGLTVITNHHVIDTHPADDAKQSLVIFIGPGKQPEVRAVTVIESDREHDLSVLRVSGAPLPALQLSDGNSVREGQAVALIGFPIGAVLGLFPSTNAGIVSAISPIAIPQASSQSLTAAQIRRLQKPFDVYQLDAIAYPGNSGSPVFDIASGSVIGVVNSVFARQAKEGLLKDPSAITYAIPVAYVHALLNH